MKKLWAFLVGIDQYKTGVSSLGGCVNDVHVMSDFLTTRLADVEVKLRVLVNEEATRKAVIAGFEEHLCQAKPEDTVLFYFCGHGSQAPAPKEFWPIEPDRLNETLVCYDSRTEGQSDIADKEFAALLRKVAAPDKESVPHVVVILDCCHSGSGTRSIGVRRAWPDTRPRPLSDYIDGVVPPQSRSGDASDGGSASGWTMRGARHVLLAACRSHEEAKEVTIGDRRGVFSLCLIESLIQAADGGQLLSYRDFLARVTAKVRSKVRDQTPALEASFPEDEALSVFSGVRVPRTPGFLVSYDAENQKWTLDTGSTSGVAPPKDGEFTTISLFPEDSTDASLAKREVEPVGFARVTSVSADRSFVELFTTDGDEIVPYKAEKSRVFKCLINNVPLPSCGVFLVGSQDGMEAVRKAIEEANQGNPSVFVTEFKDETRARLTVICDSERFSIASACERDPLVAAVDDKELADRARKTVERLEHIARWFTVAELSNPDTSQVSPNDIELTIKRMPDEHAVQEGETLVYDGDEPPVLTFALTNRSSHRLYFSFIDVAQSFKLRPIPLFGDLILDLGPGETRGPSDEVLFKIPDSYLGSGVSLFTDTMMVFASTQRFDPSRLEQTELEPPRGVPSTRVVRGPTSSPLELLLDHALLRTRDFEVRTRAVPSYWNTRSYRLTVTKDPKAVELVEGENQVGELVSVIGHSKFTAKARLLTWQQTRSLSDGVKIPLAVSDPAYSEPLALTTSRGIDDRSFALEFSEVEHPEEVTEQTPLELYLDVPLDPEDTVLCYGYDGEFYVPAGYGMPSGKRVEVRLTNLPTTSTRGLFSSVKLFFRKIKCRLTGAEFSHPRLCKIEFDEDGAPVYKLWSELSDEDKDAMRAADRVLLFTHGIIGETTVMVTAALNGQKPGRLLDSYNAILAFDYENLSTEIDQTARELKAKLAEFGIDSERYGPGKKVLDIVSHSMGGLVGRYFVEYEGGNTMVNHLVCVGTPSGGSPLPGAYASLKNAFLVGVNNLVPTPWPPSAAPWLAKAIAKALKVSHQVTLDQMTPGSRFLAALGTVADPNVRYTLIAGNTTKIKGAVAAGRDERQGKIGRLIDRWGHEAANWTLFANEPNDIAVAVESVFNVDPNRRPAPETDEIPCDHITYFVMPEGLEAIRTALRSR